MGYLGTAIWQIVLEAIATRFSLNSLPGFLHKVSLINYPEAFMLNSRVTFFLTAALTPAQSMSQSPSVPDSTLSAIIRLLRWDKPAGRLILMIPALWASILGG